MDLSSYEHIEFRRDGHVLVMTLNRPERLNAVHPPLRRELIRAFNELDDDDESRAVLLTGAGRAFCAGGDVQRMNEQGGSNTRAKFAQVRTGEILRAHLDLEKPIVAAVNGPAIGLGATLALMCDIVVASPRARIGDRHVNIGLVAGDGGATTMSHISARVAPRPIAGPLTGPAIGLGATLALMCDIVVASPRARIGDRHVNIGLVAG